MIERGQGVSAPTRQHAPSPSNYESGHCEVGGHGRCRGAYAGTACSCPCHTSPPPEPVHTATVHCFFGCPAVVGSTDPQEAHQAMEAHYFDAHRAEIAVAVGWSA